MSELTLEIIKSNLFYVYALTDPRKNDEVFYIGKGRGYRASNHLVPAEVRRNISPKHATVRKIFSEGFTPGIKILHHGLDESTAFSLEKSLIEQYGRKCDNSGSLTNLTLGGEGTSGHVHTEETKKKMRDADRSNYTRIAPVSEETKKKLAALLTGKPGRSTGYRFSAEQRDNLSKLKQGSPGPTKGMKRVYREDGSFYFSK